MRIGVTSQNFKTITGHAGKTRRFVVFSKNPEGKLQVSEKLDLPKEMSMHEFKGSAHPLDELDVLITGSCGDGFRRKMSSRGVEVITTSETSIWSAVQRYVEGETLPSPVPHSHELTLN